MYYEIFDEIRHAKENNKEFTIQQLVNKSYLDSFYDLHSEINPIYDFSTDSKRLIQNNYPYLLTQKIINGISKGIFLGLKPGEWMNGMFLPTGRIKVPTSPLHFELNEPCLYIKKQETITYSDTSFQVWEDELMKIAPDLEKILGVRISREGFKAQLYRILEFIFGMRFDNPKRSPWIEFIHFLMIHGKSYTLEELKNSFVVEESGDWLILKDSKFKTRAYLEYFHNQKLDSLSTALATLVDTSLDSKALFSSLNQELVGKIPLSHFSIGELMFINKDEYTINQYYDWYIKPWTESKEITLFLLDNVSFQYKEAELSQFPSVLKESKYAIVLGFKANENGVDVYYSAEPKMLKD